MRLNAAASPCHQRRTRLPRAQPGAPLFDRCPIEHEPVLAPELTSLLAPEPGQTAVDCTFGGGGHARLIAERLGPEGTLIAIDRDPAAEERFGSSPPRRPAGPSSSVPTSRQVFAPCDGEGIRPDMVYMDLGMSSMQVDAWERGFSYAYDAPLDMRMDTRQEFDAADLLNEWPESRIAQVLRRFGEERYAGGIAREIVRRRPLSTTSELVAAIKAGMPASARFGAGHPAKRSFQAIRIAVNGELDALDEALPLAWALLPSAGASARSPSTRSRTGRVKQFLAARARGCVCPPELPVCVCGHEPEAELLTRRAVAPGPEEVAANPRSRSAHLRVAVKIAADPGGGRGCHRAGGAGRERRPAPRRSRPANARSAHRAPRRPRRAQPARRAAAGARRQLIPLAVGTASRSASCPTPAWSCG